MENNSDSKSFIAARDRLSLALSNLEKVIFEKLDEAKENKAGTTLQPDQYQQELIKNLNNEINSLQKTLSEIGIDNENLKKKDLQITKKLESLRSNYIKVKEDVEFDLEKIKLIINKNSGGNVDN